MAKPDEPRGCPPTDVFALDFDGVLCDSARETGVSAWRTGAVIWPEWQGSEPESACLDAFIGMRPLLETGYQAVVLMRLAQQRMTFAEVEARFDDLCRTTVEETGRTREELVRLFAATRDRWMAEDLQGWLATHRFYPGTVDAVRHALSRAVVCILTTKQERFAHQLLRNAGIGFPEDKLFGLEHGRPKECILADLVKQYGPLGARVHFVEDRMATLERCLTYPGLEGIGLYLANWGYCTEAERRRARESARIVSWDLEDMLRL